MFGVETRSRSLRPGSETLVSVLCKDQQLVQLAIMNVIKMLQKPRKLSRDRVVESGRRVVCAYLSCVPTSLDGERLQKKGHERSIGMGEMLKWSRELYLSVG